MGLQTSKMHKWQSVRVKTYILCGVYMCLQVSAKIMYMCLKCVHDHKIARISEFVNKNKELLIKTVIQKKIRKKY